MNTQPTTHIDQDATPSIRCAFSVAPDLAPEDRLSLARHLRRRLDVLNSHGPNSLDFEQADQVIMAGLTFQRLADLLEEDIPASPPPLEDRPRLSVLMAFDASAGWTDEQRAEVGEAMARQGQAMRRLRKAMIEADLMPSTADSALSLTMAAMANDLYDLQAALDQPAPLYVEHPEATLRISPSGKIEVFNTQPFPFNRADYHRPSRARALVYVSHAGRVTATALKETELTFDTQDPHQAFQATVFATRESAISMMRAAGAKLGVNLDQVIADLVKGWEAEAYGVHLNEVTAYRQAIQLLDAMGHRHASPFADRVRADEDKPGSEAGRAGFITPRR